MSSAPQSAAERWRLLKNLFQAAENLSPAEQQEFLKSACGEDAVLRAEAEALFESDRRERTNQTAQADALCDGLISFRSLIGRQIGAYEILHEIGRGGMSTVYAAARIDQQFHKIVAIKIVRPGLQSEEMLHRFQHERQLLAGLEHANIARLLDAGVTGDEIPYLVMEYVEGVPIDRYADTRNLSLGERLALFRLVCSAVQYAHQNLVVHRDLKPANILVTAEGVPKLLDFGIGKLLRPDYYGQNVDVTLPSRQPMTPEYASPEQIRGEPVTTATDIYSLGVLLYALLTGKHPFCEHLANPVALMEAILNQEAAKPSAAVSCGEKPAAVRERLRRQLSGDLDTIIAMAVRKEPQRRYRSVEHLAEDIGRYLEGRPVSARSDTTWYRAGKFVRRHTAGVIAAASAALALIGTASLAIHSAAVAHEQRTAAEQRFEQGRQFAHFVLFQLDSALQSGVTPARKLMVERALDYLNGLEKESAGDASLEREVVEAYLKVGDLQGNLRGPNLGDPAASKKSYERALEIANGLVRSHPKDASVLRDQALANMKLGDLLSTGSSKGEALRLYLAAERGLEQAIRSDPDVKRDLPDVLTRIGFTQLEMGDAQASLTSYSRYLEMAKESKERHAIAYGYERVGYLKARTGAVSEGLESLRQGLAIYREEAAANPGNGEAQRDVEVVYSLIGDIGVRREPGEAVADYRNASRIAEKLLLSDPANVQYRRDRLVVLSRLAYALAQSGAVMEARRVQSSAFRLFENAQPQVASDYDLMTYCSVLLANPPIERAKAEQALRYAKELNTRTNGRDPFALDFLAQAEDAAGDRKSALTAEETALALLPHDAAFDSRDAMERELAVLRLPPQTKH